MLRDWGGVEERQIVVEAEAVGTGLLAAAGDVEEHLKDGFANLLDCLVAGGNSAQHRYR